MEFSVSKSTRPLFIPCLGEIKLSTIQKNVKRVMKEEFSLFSLGIGFDVDFDFLERIAMDNRGIAQRIYANQNAAEQLKVPFLFCFSKCKQAMVVFDWLLIFFF